MRRREAVDPIWVLLFRTKKTNPRTPVAAGSSRDEMRFEARCRWAGYQYRVRRVVLREEGQ